MNSFSINQSIVNSALIVDLSGVLDENASLLPLELHSNQTLIIDLENLRQMNSIGIRSWLNWSRAFPKDTKVILRNIPPFFIGQINAVAAVKPAGAQIKSFYLPYICTGCDSTKRVLAVEGENFDPPQRGLESTLKLGTVKCTDCNGLMELDTFLERYQKVLNI